MLQVMRSWDLTMRGELDYREEADNLREVTTDAHACT
jgi:predicted unusual protein kinase regulating ubiquinone biosynthesis (AarF/ABC1/UbiB family)